MEDRIYSIRVMVKHYLKKCFMTLRICMLLVTGILLLLFLAQSSFAQDYFKDLYLVHEKEFNFISLSLMMDGLEDPSPRAYLYNGA